jgi:hypothetical protein
MKREDLNRKYRGLKLKDWIFLGCVVICSVALIWYFKAYEAAHHAAWRMPVDTGSRDQCVVVIIAYGLTLIAIDIVLGLAAGGPDADELRHDWQTGEVIIRGYSLREWGLVMLPFLTGFVLSFFVPRHLMLGNLPVSILVFMAGGTIGVCAGYWEKLQRDLRRQSQIGADSSEKPSKESPKP